MSAAALVLLEPAALLLCAAVVCLVLEAAGTPVGARKTGERTHLCLIALLGCAAVVGWAALRWPEAAPLVGGAPSDLGHDRLSLLASALVAGVVAAALLAALPTLRALGEERGEIYALLLAGGAALVVLVAARDLLVVAAALSLWQIAAAALSTVDREAPYGVEAAVKGVTSGGLALGLLCFAAALCYGATGETSFAALVGAAAANDPLALLASAFVVVVLLSVIGAPPAHLGFVDEVHGAPPFLAGMTAAGRLVAGAAIGARLVVEASGRLVPGDASALSVGLAVAAGLALVVSAVAALDQVRIARLAAFLAALQAGLPLAALSASAAGAPGAVVPALAVVVPAACAAAGALVGLGFLRRPGEESGTWEDWSGAGRVHPTFAVVLLFLLGTLAGVPGTGGFLPRVEVARALFSVGQDALGVLLLLSPVVAAAPVLRLGLFLFAKEPDLRLKPSPSAWRALALLALAVAAAVAGVWPDLLLDVVRASVAR